MANTPDKKDNKEIKDKVDVQDVKDNDNTKEDKAPDKDKSVVKEPKSKKVEVDADIMANILAELKDLKVKQREYEASASQDQIAKIERMRGEGKLVKSARVRHIDGKKVVGWKLVTDEVYYADGKVHEKQEYKVIFSDSSDKVMDIRDFTRKTEYQSYDVIKESKDMNGVIEYTMNTEDGEELLIKETFIN